MTALRELERAYDKASEAIARHVDSPYHDCRECPAIYRRWNERLERLVKAREDGS